LFIGFAAFRRIEKTKWREQLFVPKKPSDWNKDPNAWLSNFDISKVLNQYEKAFPYFHSIGPSSVDYDAKRNADNCVCNSLCNLSIEHEWNRGIRKLGIVFNESEHDKDGTHWVAFGSAGVLLILAAALSLTLPTKLK
jgi:hypothetical protein